MPNQSNRPGLGIEYEVLLPALYALQLCYKEDVVDYEMETNAENFGSMDDLLLTIKLKNGTERKFALQLKHKEKENKSLRGNSFQTGDFYLVKYFKSYHGIKKEDKKNYHFILFTNVKFDSKYQRDVIECTMSHFKQCPARDYCYLPKENPKNNRNSKDEGTVQEENPHIYKFEVNENSKKHFHKEIAEKAEEGMTEALTDFLSKLSFYTNQLNASEIEKRLEDLFLNRLHALKQQFHSYIKFFRDWHKRDFTDTKLNMNTVKYVIFNILLTPHVLEVPTYTSCQDKSIRSQIQKQIKNFVVTVYNNLDNSVSDSIKLVRNHSYDEQKLALTAGDHKLITKNEKVTEMSKDQKLNLEDRIFWFVERKPIVVRFTSTSRNVLTEMIKLANGSLKFILATVNADVDENEFPHLRVFRSLYDVKTENFSGFEELSAAIKISLQGRQSISLQQLITNLENDEVVKWLTLHVLLKSDSINLGEGTRDLIDYIPRRLEKVVIKTSVIDDVPNDSFMIHCGDYCDEMKVKDFIKKELVSDHSLGVSENMILMGKQYTIEHFREVKVDLDGTNFHYLRAIHSEQLEWVSTRGSLQNLRSCDNEKCSIRDFDICRPSNNKVNLICGMSGVGKSSTMKFVLSKFPSSYWAVRIKMIEHNNFFTQQRDMKQFIDYFLHKDNSDPLTTSLLQSFLRKNHVVWFFDGVDEIEKEGIPNLVDCVKQLASEGHIVWLSARSYLQEQLENAFCVLALTIEDLGEESQKSYIRKRLSKTYSSEEIEGVTEKIYKKTGRASKTKLFGGPLQLHMLTELLLESDVKRGCLRITKIFHHFIFDKLWRFYKKTGGERLHYFEEEVKAKLKSCQKFALKSCLDKTLFSSLNIECDDYDERLGMMYQTKDGTIIFEHRTLAEYLVALWLTENFRTIPRSQRDFLFRKEHENIRSLGNMILDDKIRQDGTDDIDQKRQEILKRFAEFNAVVPTEVISSNVATKIEEIRQVATEHGCLQIIKYLTSKYHDINLSDVQLF